MVKMCSLDKKRFERSWVILDQFWMESHWSLHRPFEDELWVAHLILCYATWRPFLCNIISLIGHSLYIYLCKQIAIRANTKEHWSKVLPGKTWMKHCCYSNHNICTVVCSTGSLRNMGKAITVCWGRQGLPELCKRGSDRARLLKERLNWSLLNQIYD